MIWFVHKKYTPDYYAGKLATILGEARCSTRCMAFVAGSAVSILAMIQMSCIYGL